MKHVNGSKGPDSPRKCGGCTACDKAAPCAWLKGAYSSGSRPDRSGIVVDIGVTLWPRPGEEIAEDQSNLIEVPTFKVYPVWEKGHETPRANRQIKRMMPNGLVMLVTPAERRILGGPQQYVEMAEYAFYQATGGKSSIVVTLDQHNELLLRQRAGLMQGFIDSADKETENG